LDGIGLSEAAYITEKENRSNQKEQEGPANKHTEEAFVEQLNWLAQYFDGVRPVAVLV